MSEPSSLVVQGRDFEYSEDIHSGESKKFLAELGLEYDEISGQYFDRTGKLVRPSIVNEMLKGRT